MTAPAVVTITLPYVTASKILHAGGWRSDQRGRLVKGFAECWTTSEALELELDFLSRAGER